MIRFFARSRRNLGREASVWIVSAMSALAIFVQVFSPFAQVLAAVVPNGTIIYGDITNAGIPKFQTYTSPFTWGTEISTAITGTASNIHFVVSKRAPTRDEIMMGHLKADGRLDVLKCIGSCDAAADWSAQVNNAGTTPAQTCNGTYVDCQRAYDIGYERLSGRALVVYADSVAGKLYYCLYDGTSWSPQAACTPTNGTNDIDISTQANGVPKWVDLKFKSGTNEAMILASVDVAGVMELVAVRWDGTSFLDKTNITATTKASTQGLERGRPYGFDWETNSGDGMVVWGTTTGGATAYRIWTGGAWGTETAGPSQPSTGAVAWASVEADPSSNRLALATNDSLNDFTPSIWKANGTTAGWTSGNTSTTLENGALGPNYADVIWENFSSVAIFVLFPTAAVLDWAYETATCTGSGCTFTAIDATIPVPATTDDATSIQVTGSPNSDELIMLGGDIDRNLHSQYWTGSAWNSTSTTREVDVPGAAADNTFYANIPWYFTYKRYWPWQHNWRWYAGTDTASIPTTAKAAENTTPTGITLGEILRLRVNYSEKANASETDSRKKLQYASGCTPNSSETACTWTDVGDTVDTTIWRYKDLTCTATDCADGTLLTGTVLTGTNATCTAGNGCGTWVLDKDAAAGVNMDHSALVDAQENEYIIENNGAVGSTTYYFRLYDIGDLSAVRREQDNDGANDCALATCTYPSLTTAADPVFDQDGYRWRSDDGAENAGTSLVAENTKLTSMAKNTNYRLRFLVENTGGSGSRDLRVDWAARVGATCDTDETYAAIPDIAGTEHFEMTLTSNYTDGTASTNVTTGAGVLTNPGAGTFQAGELVEEISNKTGAISYSANVYTESEYNFIANNNATDSGEYCLRLSNNGTALNTYTRYAEVSIAAPAGPTTDQVLRHGNWWSSGVEQDFFWAK